MHGWSNIYRKYIYFNVISYPVQNTTWILLLKGCTVYPQSDVSLAIVDIDASKGFVDLWVHFFLATECINRNDYQRKVLFWGLTKFKHV